MAAGKRMLSVLSLLLVAATAQADSEPKEWRFGLTPYLWLPTIDGTLKYDLPPGGGGSPNVEVGPADWLGLLNFGLLLNGTAQKGRFSFYADLAYLSMTSENDGRVVSVGSGTGLLPVSANINLDTQTDVDGLLLALLAGYTYSDTPGGSHTVFGGARYYGADVKTSWNLSADVTTSTGATVLPANGNISADEDVWDGVVGVRGHVKFSNGYWSMPYYFDVGAG